MRYRVFTRNPDSTYTFACESMSLGDGLDDLRHIEESDELRAGDIIYISDYFYTLDANSGWRMVDATDIVNGRPWDDRAARYLYALATERSYR